MTDNTKKTIAFDVDGTLIDFDDSPRWEVITVLRLLHELGHRIVVWSGGGADYAEMWSNKLFIRDMVDEYRQKTQQDAEWLGADICFDDEVVNLAKVNIKV